MEKIQSAEIGLPTTLIDCTPKELRELADKMESSASRAVEGSSIIIKFSKSVSLHYKVKTPFKFVGSTYRDTESITC